MEELKEYVVLLKDKNDLENFYEDMETPGGNLWIPSRRVDVANRREISRNTHYYLTDSEVKKLIQDPRVQSISKTIKDLGIEEVPCYTQSSDYWDKSATNTNTHKNWALLRCYEGSQRSNWGYDSTSGQSGTIRVTNEGRNVDVVICDGRINPDHPEYAVNADGTGGSRVIQYNWRQHDATPGTYIYTPYFISSATGLDVTRNENNDHGAHVAGIAVGNTNGWARSANIYNIDPYTATDPNGLGSTYVFDYIRAFHAAKSINPATGRKNPTIVNCSWGLNVQSFLGSSLTSVTYRGVTDALSSPSESTLLAYGIYLDAVGRVQRVGSQNASIDADIADAIAEGIIIVAGAGNYKYKLDRPGGVDYDNVTSSLLVTYYYNRGGTPGSTANVISIGALDALATEKKVDFSNCGPRLDMMTPGTYIMSSFNGNAGNVSQGATTDSRDSNYYIGKISGTSMASPQAAGILACALETYPNMTQAQALEYISTYAKSNQITDGTGTQGDHTNLQDAPNKYVYYKQERGDSGDVWPKKNYFLRSSSGAVFPRTKKSKIMYL